ncbi:helix-turn-helix domain-containing protein [Paenibacillus cymbidii]|uniref:helix-turn-helix domain-containing protein n=1 Tax=Paenibacillus cymbidii TaxID=1639034 RepID=UPI0010805486|nr:helix-turn-helix domain-containing protein [Paenibacillus cymbidii]
MFQKPIRRLSARRPQAIPYKSRLTFYYVYTLLVILVSASLSAYFFDKSLSGEIAVSNKRLLTQLRISTDAKLASLQSYVLENMVNSYQNNGAATFLAGKDPNDAYQILKAFTSLSLTSFGDFVDSAFIYRLADDTLISSREGVIFAAADPGNYSRNYFRSETLREALRQGAPVSWISPARNRSALDNKSMLSLVYAVPLFAPREDKNGLIVINIDEDKFVQTINSDNIDYGLYMFGPDNSVMVHLDGNGAVPPGNAGAIAEAAAGAEGFAKTNIGGAAVGVSWVTSALNGWKYVSYVPAEALNKQRNLALQLAIALVALFIPVSLLGLRVVAGRVNRPVRQMISSLTSRVREMEQVLADNYPLVRHKVLDDLVRGQGSDAGRELASQLRLAGIAFPYGRFAVCITELSDGDMAPLTAEQREYATIKTMEAIDALLQTRTIRAYSLTIGRNRVVTIVNAAGGDEIGAALRGWASGGGLPFGIAANAALSETADSPAQLGRLYEQAESYLVYRFMHGYGRLFESVAMEPLLAGEAKLPARRLEELAAPLLAGRTEEARVQLAAICGELEGGAFSYPYVQSVLMDIAALIDRQAAELQLGDGEFDKQRLLAGLRQGQSLEECRLWLEDNVTRFGERLAARIDAAADPLGVKITSFIVGHIDKDLSLQTVAEHFHLSPTYLSRMFKDIAGVNFSAFVTDQKLQRARQLLMADRKLKVTQVANQLGYYNLPYFSAIFKEKFGMTPMQLRKLDLE